MIGISSSLNLKLSKHTNACVEVEYKFLRVQCYPSNIFVFEIQYSNCTNYEGRKILVLKVTMLELLQMKWIDPHFIENGPLLARFVPTEEGWSHANVYASQIS